MSLTFCGVFHTWISSTLFEVIEIPLSDILYLKNSTLLRWKHNFSILTHSLVFLTCSITYLTNEPYSSIIHHVQDSDKAVHLTPSFSSPCHGWTGPLELVPWVQLSPKSPPAQTRAWANTMKPRPIWMLVLNRQVNSAEAAPTSVPNRPVRRSEEHTSELQSPC